VSGLAVAGISGIEVDEIALRFSQLSPFTTLLFWLGPINIILGVFNLIPGFPLDGGRVVRSGIWAVTQDFSKATSIASFFGRLISWIFMLIGLLMVLGFRFPILGTGFFNGIWIIFLGWFLNKAAGQEA
jgi:Zn-dependent protease